MPQRQFLRTEILKFCGTDEREALDIFGQLIRNVGPSIAGALGAPFSWPDWPAVVRENFVDRTEEVFWMKAWKKRTTFDPDRPLVDQLFELAEKVAISELRAALSYSRKNIVIRALLELTDKQRAVISLRLDGEEKNWTQQPAKDPNCPYFSVDELDDGPDDDELDDKTVQQRQAALRTAWHRVRKRLIEELAKLIADEKDGENGDGGKGCS